MSSQLSITGSLVSREKKIKEIILNGVLDEITTNDKNIHSGIESQLKEKDIEFIVFNLKNLSFINSKGIGFLVSLYTHLAREGKKAILTEAVPQVMDIIDLTGLTKIIDYYNSTNEAIQAISAQ